MKKLTLSVGIPAHNEENNIVNLIDSILKQNTTNYELKGILVVSDGSTDKTVHLVEELQKKDSRVQVLNRPDRKGKADALNLIYSMNTSDLLFIPDADIVLKNNECLDEMVACFIQKPSLNLVSARHIPAQTNTLMGKFAVFSYKSLEDTFMQLNNGNNFYSVMSASMLSKKFAYSFKYPKGTLSDQNYVYAQATRENTDNYAFAKKAEVVFAPVTTFNDWRLLGLRSVIGDKEDVAKHFGEEILVEYSLPKSLILKTQLKWFLKHPFYMLGSVFMNIVIRIFPLQKSKPENGMWQASESSKIRIIL